MNQSSKPINVPLSLRQTDRRSPSLWRSTGIFVWRSFQNTKNNLFSFVMDTVMGPVLILCIFTFLFGGAIAGSSTEYVQFLLPGMFILTVVPMTVYSGTQSASTFPRGCTTGFARCLSGNRPLFWAHLLPTACVTRRRCSLRLGSAS